MPRARLELQSDEGLITLSEAHPEVALELLGAWPRDDRLRALLETEDLDAVTWRRQSRTARLCGT